MVSSRSFALISSRLNQKYLSKLETHNWNPNISVNTKISRHAGMAPILLQPHSCHHCQKLLIDEHKPVNKTDGEEKNYVHFDYTVSDIPAAALDGCSFFTWLLDEEWVHRSAIVDAFRERALRTRGSLGVLLKAIESATVRIGHTMPAPNAANTLRRNIEDSEDDRLDSLRLICFLKSSRDIEFFGLWDPVSKEITYRTRNGFSIFTTSGTFN